ALDGGMLRSEVTVTIAGSAEYVLRYTAATPPPPAVTITGAPASSPEGTAISLSSTVTSPLAANMAAGFSYAWSGRKDGTSYASGTSGNFSFRPTDDGTYVVTLVATAQDKSSGTATQAITVPDAGPTANANGPYTATAGFPLIFKGTATDPSPIDTVRPL